ncbi:hypothetical protein EPUL_003299 [Erysiphe pulchra]|uniref:Probable transporter MCH1 n=1 Tax=Erysiphe pulchra TaxID=225359 RepID=A0A2S4PN09_9PEZI|nr:hypothetical protein EPUL_003299 [Erysiphe pulchra]
MSDAETSPLLASRSNSLTRSVSSGRNCKLRKADIIRFSSLFSAIFSCLCAGSISTFSLYGHLLQTRLNYTQTQVNTVALAAQTTLCLSVSFVGYLCDRIQPAFISLSSAIIFGVGYLTAAFTYKNGANSVFNQTGPSATSLWVMATSFIMIGLATTLILALASPIAAIGLSGFWQSQIGSKLFIERSPDGQKEEIDVFKYFIFLASILMVAGFVGFLLLKIADEQDLIKEAIGQHERNRLLENNKNSLGNQIDQSTSVSAFNDVGADPLQRNPSKEEKSHFLNLKTAMFVRDPTMWIFATGFLLVSGTGDAFITNLGTVVGTLNQSYKESDSLSTTVATQVSIVSLTSTAARLIFGSLTDVLAPAPTSNFDNRSAHSIVNRKLRPSDFTISRIIFLIGSALILSAGQVFLAAGFAQNHESRFWFVSMSIGFGYGAVFTLSPLIVSIVWGIENFGTNWGIIATTPVLCITFWDLIYSKIYEAGTRSTSNDHHLENGILCYGKACYSATFWSMAVSVWIACALWLWAWKGKQGWAMRKVAV